MGQLEPQPGRPRNSWAGCYLQHPGLTLGLPDARSQFTLNLCSISPQVQSL